jgi:nucleotide-binding universal stress UspA family protein
VPESKAYRKILVGVDGSAAGRAGLREALRLAKSQGAELCIVHVVNEVIPYTPPVGAPPVDLSEQLRDSGRRVLDQASAQAKRTGVAARTVLVEGGRRGAAESIVGEAHKRRADLIVLGTHGRRGLRRMVLGSDAEQVLRSARTPVLLVRAPA